PRRLCVCLLTAYLGFGMLGRAPVRAEEPPHRLVLKPQRIFDGASAELRAGVVVVEADRIVSVGDARDASGGPGAKVVDLAGLTLLPGLIDAHSHILLHPYNETPWND